MNKYLVSYVYDGERSGIGRAVLSLREIDIKDIESTLEKSLDFNKVLVISITKINQKKKARKAHKGLFQRIFPKRYMKIQFKKAIKKEFNC